MPSLDGVPFSLAGRAWVSAVQLLGGSIDAARAAAADLDRRYAEPHRRYHTGAHADAVVRDSAWLAGQLGLDGGVAALVTLAAGAHDVVYDARPGVDERASAEWARQQLADSGVGPAAAGRVVELVLATITHAPAPGDRPAAALLDADLAILGAGSAVYDDYVAAVRQEYAAVSDEWWRRGRTEVLADLASHDRLYVCDAAERRWGEPARRNVERELAGLAGLAGEPL